MSKKHNKDQARAERDARLQQQLRDNLRRRKTQVKGRNELDDSQAPLPRDGKIGVAKLNEPK